MAVTKIWKVTSNCNRTIDYVMNPEKTEEILENVTSYVTDEEKTDGRHYVTALNCNTTCVKRQFLAVKKRYGKEDGILAFHGYQSFAEYDNITPQIAHEIGVKFAEKMWGDRFQVIVSTHLNTDCLHNHFLINSVSFADGMKYHDCRAAYRQMREVSDELCREYGLAVIEKPKKGSEKLYYAQLNKDGMPTRINLVKNAVDEAILKSRNLKDLEMILSAMGYMSQFKNNRKYWTVIPKGWEKPVRLERIGSDYTKQRILERIEANINNIDFRLFHKTYRKQYTLMTRKNRIVKIRGIRGTYIRYCFLLGYLPKYTQKQKNVHYLLRDDLLKCEKYTKQIRLLSENCIHNETDLERYIKQKKERLHNLEISRNEKRKIIRRKIPEMEKEKIRYEISGISKEMKKVREEIRLSEDIGIKADDMEKRMRKIEVEKEGRKR